MVWVVDVLCFVFDCCFDCDGLLMVFGGICLVLVCLIRLRIRLVVDGF